MQKEIFRAMARADFYPHPVRKVSRKETHISMVFLTGEYVYKVKKPFDFGFLDFTTLEKRELYCRREVALNRRLAEDVYLGVVAITREEEGFGLDGPGPVVEYAVKMRQLQEECVMSRMLRRKAVGKPEVAALAAHLSGFYDRAEAGKRIDAVGTWETAKGNCEENFSQTEGFAGRFFDEDRFRIVRAATLGFLRRHEGLFARRVAKGRIRDCHGDLRTGHIYFPGGLAGGIRIIDCIEFNERFRYSDTAADLAFLVMDLDYEGFPDMACALLSEFVRRTGDGELLVLIDFYKCYRAFVRVKVNCLRLAEGGLSDDGRQRLQAETGRFLSLAFRYALRFSRPTLWVVCGMIAAGKSTMAALLAESLGLSVLRSDVLRKEIFGMKPQEKGEAPFGRGIYSRGATALTYGRLFLAAAKEIAAGKSVILDATFGSPRNRREAMRLAEITGARPMFVECAASGAVLRKRLAAREGRKGVSDARLSHLEGQMMRYAAPEEVAEDNRIRIDTRKRPEENLRRILFHDYARQ